MANITEILTKIRDNFSPPHRIALYHTILREARSTGYQFLTLAELAAAQEPPSAPFIILRHDIDTDPRAALDFAAAEAKEDIRATYFFRLTTWNKDIIDLLHAQGHEVGYHFEELASYAKKKHIRSKAEVIAAFPDIRRIFAQNLAQLRGLHSFEINSCASHGDFANLVVDCGNYKFLRDAELRHELGIAYEAYDHELVNAYQNHVSDWNSPQGFNPAHPLSYIRARKSFLFLTHPRWWRVNPLANFRFDLKVWVERFLWRLG